MLRRLKCRQISFDTSFPLMPLVPLRHPHGSNILSCAAVVENGIPSRRFHRSTSSSLASPLVATESHSKSKVKKKTKKKKSNKPEKNESSSSTTSTSSTTSVSDSSSSPSIASDTAVDRNTNKSTVFAIDENNESLAKFYKLGLIGSLCRASVLNLNFREPTPIQQQVIPLALKNQHVVASAETGTGKTAAYAFPVIQRFFTQRNLYDLSSSNASRPIRAVILCPTRELAEQVHRNVVEYVELVKRQQTQKWDLEREDNLSDSKDEKEKEKDKKPFRLNVLLITGKGQTMQRQEQLINSKKVDVVVATPGRLAELLRRRSWMKGTDFEAPSQTGGEKKLVEPPEAVLISNPLIHVEQFVVDECDRMLSMGFLPDLRELFFYLPRPLSKKKKNKRKSRRNDQLSQLQRPMQVMMFTATLVPQIDGLMKRFAPTHALVNLNQEMKVAGSVKHVQFLVSHARKKFSLMLYLLQRKKGASSLKHKKVLVFCRTRRRCDVLAQRLQECGFSAFSVHKGKSAAVRTRAVEMFRAPLTEEYLKKEGKLSQSRGLIESSSRAPEDQDNSPHLVKQEILLKDYQMKRAARDATNEIATMNDEYDDDDWGDDDNDEMEIEDVIATTKYLEMLKQPVQILISTDVLSRGIDVEDLPFVINYDPPAMPEDYVHRVGRTGRAGQQGMAISFVSMTPQIVRIGGRDTEINEMHFMRFVEKFLKERVELRKVPGPWRDNEYVMPKLQHLRDMGEGSEIPMQPGEKQALLRSRQLGLELLNQKRLKEKRRLQHLRRHNRLRGTFVERFSESYRTLKQKIAESGDMKDAVLQHAPSMRNFKEGRYEDVVRQFEERRAVHRGVLKPSVPGSGRKTKRVKGKKKNINLNAVEQRFIL